MRKLLLTISVAAALVASAAGVAQGAGVTNRCGVKYHPSCTAPKVTSKTPSAACAQASTGYTLPNITFVSDAGIQKITITVNSVVKTISFSGNGPTQYTLKALKLKTIGLVAGAHSVKITVTDVRGKSASKTLPFSVCAAKPVFTG